MHLNWENIYCVVFERYSVVLWITAFNFIHKMIHNNVKVKNGK